MNCDEATLLISARIDGGLAGDGPAALDAHLAECEACRAALSEMELQDAALLRAFMPQREAAYTLAARVAQAMSRDSAASASKGRPGANSKRLKLLAGWLTAAAAGFGAAIVITRPANRRPAVEYPVQTQVPPQSNVPVARLVLATGEVFACPSQEKAWQPIALNDPIDLLADIRTVDAKCELRLPDGSCLRLNSGTEARFTGGRTVAVSAGEVWSAVPRDAAPLCVSAGQACVTSHGSGDDSGAQFDVMRAADAATVTVHHGAAQVAGDGPPTIVHGGQVLRAPSPPGVFVCRAAPDPPVAPRWQDDLLVLKPGDDPEVVARVDQLLGRISKDRGTSESPGATELDVRARGQAWCMPFACYIRNQPGDGEKRRTAARLLADLAPPARIPDLIALLADVDGQVRYQAAVALHRLSGVTLGFPPNHFPDTRDLAAVDVWRQWWKQNESRYGALK